MAINYINFENTNYKRFEELKSGDILYCFKFGPLGDIIFEDIILEKSLTPREYYDVLYKDYDDHTVAETMFNSRSSYNKEMEVKNVIFYLPKYIEKCNINPMREWNGTLMFDKSASCVEIFDFTDGNNEDIIYLFSNDEERQITSKEICTKLLNNYKDTYDLLRIKMDKLETYVNKNGKN